MRGGGTTNPAAQLTRLSPTMLNNSGQTDVHTMALKGVISLLGKRIYTIAMPKAMCDKNRQWALDRASLIIRQTQYQSLKAHFYCIYFHLAWKKPVHYIIQPRDANYIHAVAAAAVQLVITDFCQRHRTRNIGPALFQWWAIVADVGQAANQSRVNVSYLLAGLLKHLH